MSRISSMCDDPKSKCICCILPPIQPCGMNRSSYKVGLPATMKHMPKVAPLVVRLDAFKYMPEVISDYGFYGFKINVNTCISEFDDAYEKNLGEPVIHELNDGSKIHIGPSSQVLSNSHHLVQLH
jgi:hypothetical protein